jgi:hypothetical protein
MAIPGTPAPLWVIRATPQSLIFQAACTPARNIWKGCALSGKYYLPKSQNGVIFPVLVFTD